MSDTQSFQVDPEAHESASRGDTPYVSDEAKAGLPEGVTTTPEEVVPAEGSEEASTEAAETPTEEVEAEAADDTKEETPAETPTQFQEWFNEFIETGELNEESRESAMNTIFHPDLDPKLKAQYVEQFLGGLKSTMDVSVLSAWGLVGGQESFESMIAWAKANLSADESAAFDAQVQTGGVPAKVAIEGLHARYQQSDGIGNEPDLSHAADASTSGVPTITSRAQLAKIAGSEKYKSDPHYRDQIAERVRLQVERHGELKAF